MKFADLVVSIAIITCCAYFVSLRMLYLIGLGLSDPKDITVKGLEAVQKCTRVFIDAYTSILMVGHEELEKFLGKKVELADRDLVEQSDEIVSSSSTSDVAFLVVGDPLGATTHTDLIERAVESNVPYTVIHNASILNAIGCCGLQLYQFAETVSIPFWEEYTHPESFYDKAAGNFVRGLHTLCLLDIKVKEQSMENLLRGRKVFEPPRYMSCSQAALQLMQIIDRRTKAVGNLGDEEIDDDTPQLPYPITGECLAVGVARVGSANQALLVTSLADMANDATSSSALGGPLHSLVLPGHMHPMERSVLRRWMPNAELADQLFERHDRALAVCRINN